MARESIEKHEIKAFLGDETEFTGYLTFEGTVRIDGKFEGEIKTNDYLIIGETAHIKAEISVGAMMVQGKVEGNINASRKLHITSKGVVIGNVSATALHIEDGATLEGSVHMMKSGAEDNVLPLTRRKAKEGDEAKSAVSA
ncbi:MAG: polymer-forming cytoskeletal protein [Nitrospinae bacterium]|nr:polymer-forming cytoskeletal protein [Nitrospinota bacterium]